MRARATTPARGVPAGDPFDANLGTALRVGCSAAPQMLVVPKVAPFEIVFADDTLNSILHAAWWGGLLTFPVGTDLLGDFDLSGLGVIIHSIDLNALLPPLASDCGPDGLLRLHVADLEVTADLDFIGTPLIITVYASFDAPITLSATGGELAVSIAALEHVEMEVHVDDETQLEVEPVFEDLLMSQLVGSLEGLLGGGEPLFAFPLPEIDLSDSLGMAPGSLVIAIETLSDPAWAPRIDGNTVVYGQLK
jgi:hypothetical protein